MDPVSRNRTTPLVKATIASAPGQDSLQASPQASSQASLQASSQIPSQARPHAGAALPVSARPASLRLVGQSRSRMIFKERFKGRFSEPEGPSPDHGRAQDLSLYRVQLGDALLMDTAGARRLKKALVALHRLYASREPGVSLPVFVHSLLRQTQTGSAQPAAWQQIPPGLTAADAFLSLVLGTQQLTASTCTASDVAAIEDSLQIIKQEIDPQRATDIANDADLSYFIRIVAKNAGPLVSQLFLAADLIPLDRDPKRPCPNTRYLTLIAIEHAGPAFTKELALSTIKENDASARVLLHKLLATPNCGVDVLKKFVEAGYDLVEQRFDGGATALHLAAYSNDRAVVEYLLSLRGRGRAKLDINANAPRGGNALCLAAFNPEHGAAIATLLLDRGARLDYDATTELHPLKYMVRENNVAGLKAIFDGVSRRQREALINGGYSPVGMPLISYAVLKGSAAIVDTILSVAPAERERLKVETRLLFETLIKETTNHANPDDSMLEVLGRIPVSLLRELDQIFSFHLQASSLPASQVVMDCLVKFNERTARASGEPVFVIDGPQDERSEVLGLALSRLDEQNRTAMIRALARNTVEVTRCS